jgi:hypothetical protein
MSKHPRLCSGGRAHECFGYDREKDCSTSPSSLSTEDGGLCLAISGDTAKDLRIDLDQFLAQE